MRAFLVVLAAAPMVGCGQKPTATHIAPKTDYSEQEIDRSARVGDPANPGREAYNQGQLSDKELLELEARRHKAAMSGITAQAVVKDMRSAEQDAKVAAGLVEPPMTEEQKAKRLAEIRKALSEVEAYKRRAAATVQAVPATPPPIPAAPETSSGSGPGLALASSMGMTLESLCTLYNGILVTRPAGFLVQRVERGSVADRAGVREGDFLLGTNGVYFTDGTEENLRVRLKELGEFQNPKINVLRGAGYRELVSLDAKGR